MTADSTSAPRLRVEQTRFVQAFFADGSARSQVLEAPTGAGKTYVSASIIDEGIRRGLFKRVLVIAPSINALLEQLVRVVEARELPLPVVRLTKAVFLEFETPGASPLTWNDSFVGIIGALVFRQQKVLSRLLQVPWDLVIVDDRQMLSNESRLALDQLARVSTVGRLLVMTSIWRQSRGRYLPQPVEVTRWSLHQFVDNRAIEFEPLDYARTQSEIDLLARLVGLVETYSLKHSRIRARREILGAAASSMYSAQAVLLRERLKLLDGTDPALRPQPDDQDGPLQGRRTDENWWSSKSIVVELMTNIISDLDTLTVDLKLRSLRDAVQGSLSKPTASAPLLVVTGDERTADYLKAAFAESSSSPTYAEDHDGGRRVGVLTDRDLRTFEGAAGREWIYYDPPATNSALERRRGRALVGAFGHSVFVHYMRDPQASNPLEADWSRRYSRFLP